MTSQKMEFETSMKSDNKNSVWHYFLRGKLNRDLSKCIVSNCGKLIICNGGSTSGMHAHLKAFHNIILQRKSTFVENNNDIDSVGFSKNNSLNFVPISQYFYTKADNSLPAVLSRLIACDGISFNTICKSYDIRQGLMARGFTEIPKSKTGVANVVQKYGEKIHQQIKNEFSQIKKQNKKFSLSFDEWTSVRNRRYINLNVHSDTKTWNLGLCRAIGTVPAEKYISIIERKLNTFDLSIQSDVVAISTDGASVLRRVGSIINADHQICLAHAIQLAVIEVLYSHQNQQYDEIIPTFSDIQENVDEIATSDDEKIPTSDDEEQELEIVLEIQSSYNDFNSTLNNFQPLNQSISAIINKIRKVVKVFRRSPTKNDGILQNYVKQEFSTELNLILDCKTRWNSLFNMLERFNKLKGCVQKALIDAKEKIHFTNAEFDLISNIISALTPIKITVESLCCKETDIYKADIALEFMMEELTKQSFPLSNDLRTALVKRLSQRRFVYADLFRFLHTSDNKVSNSYGIFNQVSITNLTSQIVSLVERFSGETTTGLGTFPNREKGVDIIDDEDIHINNEQKMEQVGLGQLMSLKDRLQKRIMERSTIPITYTPNKKSKVDIIRVIKSEIRYFQDEGVKGKYLNMVYECLKTVRPTSIDSERAFSAAGAIVTRMRSTLSDTNINNLCFLRSYFKNM